MHHTSPLGLTAVDRDGVVVGRITGTFPYDGSTPEFAVIRLGAFGYHRMIPLQATVRYDETLQFPYTRADMADAPEVEACRYVDDQVMAARSYWGTHRPESHLGFEMLAKLRELLLT